ncbi:MAG: glutathione S-transferase family protein [Burkholderiaceae bacterium]
MKLHFALASPFARKVRVCAIELGIDDKIELVPTAVAPGTPNAEYSGRFNPIRRIPALTLSGGNTLVDSDVICEYLCNFVGGNKLYPKASTRRWEVLSDHALADGMTELAVLLRYETALRPEGLRWQALIDDYLEKINSGLSRFESQIPEISKRALDISQIALACLLGYLDFRFVEQIPWRENSPGLAAWYQEFSERPSMTNTRPDAS